MPPRTRAAVRGRGGPNTSDGASVQAEQPPVRGPGRGQGRGRGRGLRRGRVEQTPELETQTQAPEAQPDLGGPVVQLLVAELRELRQQFQQIQHTVAGLSGNRAEG